MTYHINCYPKGHIKFKLQGAKQYHAIMRFVGINRWSLRHFGTATEADQYGDRLAQRFKMLKLAADMEAI